MACKARLASARIQWQQEYISWLWRKMMSILCYIWECVFFFQLGEEQICSNTFMMSKKRGLKRERYTEKLCDHCIHNICIQHFTIWGVAAVSHLTSKWNSITMTNYSVCFACYFCSQIWQIQFSLSFDTSSMHRRPF